MSSLRPILSGDVSRILLFLKALRYERHEEILPEFLRTVKNLSFAPGGPVWYCCGRTLPTMGRETCTKTSLSHAGGWALACCTCRPLGMDGPVFTMGTVEQSRSLRAVTRAR